MLFKSGILTQISGSFGGITGSHNSAGMYLRARAIPVNPNSPQQQFVRGLVAQLTSAWLAILTGIQRQAWATYAANVPLMGPLGNPRVVPPLSQYVRSNVPRIQAGLPRVDDAPVIFNLGDFTPPTFTDFNATVGNFKVNFTEADDWVSEDDSSMIFLSSRGQNPTINYFKGPYRYAGNIDGEVAVPPTTPATIIGIFPLVVDNLTFVQCRVSRADGRLSLPFLGNGLGA